MATLLKTKALYRTVHSQAALNAVHTLTVSGARQEPVEVFLRQSNINDARAHHCVAMALIILGLVKRSAVINQATRKSGIAAQLFQPLADGWFKGFHAKPLFDAIESMKLPLVARLASEFKGIDAFAAKALLDGNLVLLAYESERNRHWHWILALGVGGFQTGKSIAVDTLLMLCPSSDPVSLASYNARLYREQATKLTKASASASWQFESMPYSLEPVRLMSAISLEPSELLDNFDLHN